MWCLADRCYTQGFNIEQCDNWELNRTSPLFEIWQLTLGDAMGLIGAALSRLCRGHTFRAVIRSALMIAGHLIAVTHWNLNRCAVRFLCSIDPGSTCARSSARKQHALVCDRLNYILYKIVNNICILYTRLVFPTVKGKSQGWKREVQV